MFFLPCRHAWRRHACHGVLGEFVEICCQLLELWYWKKKENCSLTLLGTQNTEGFVCATWTNSSVSWGSLLFALGHIWEYLRLQNFVHINFQRFLSQPMSLPKPTDILITKSHLHRGPYIFIHIVRIINFFIYKKWLAKS